MHHTSLAESLFSAISAPFCKCRVGIDRTLRNYAVKPVLRLRLLTAGLRVRAQARLHLQTFYFFPFTEWRNRQHHRPVRKSATNAFAAIVTPRKWIACVARSLA